MIQMLTTCISVSVFAILRSPMILIGLVIMVLFFGLPYLVENSES